MKLKFRVLVILIAVFFGVSLYSQSTGPKYAVSLLFTPVLNTPDFESVFGGPDGMNVKLDSKGLIREMEFVAFPKTVFMVQEIISKGDHDILMVTTNDYPYNSSGLFIDSRFVKLSDTLIEDRAKHLPGKDEIISRMKSLSGVPYMWGGNANAGIEQMLEFYKPKSSLNEDVKRNWCIKGVDCSGLLYETTDGSTPRNTSSLINYGEAVDIKNKSASEIASMLQPLDLIVWSGHVIIVLDENTVIESTPGDGVHQSDLSARIKSVMKERIPVSDWNSTDRKRFVVRRWIE